MFTPAILDYHRYCWSIVDRLGGEIDIYLTRLFLAECPGELTLTDVTSLSPVAPPRSIDANHPFSCYISDVL